MTTNKQKIIQHTQNWLQSFIIDLNICPFAKREVSRNTLRIEVSEAKAEKEAMADFYQELINLNRKQEIETTLLIYPHFLQDFYDYLDFLHLAENRIDEEGLLGVYQIASFHPQYCFADANINDVSNYTNRSPYPMLHLLREESVEKAIAFYGDTSQIPHNNIKKMHNLGLSKIKEILKLC